MWIGGDGMRIGWDGVRIGGGEVRRKAIVTTEMLEGCVWLCRRRGFMT